MPRKPNKPRKTPKSLADLRSLFQHPAVRGITQSWGSLDNLKEQALRRDSTHRKLSRRPEILKSVTKQYGGPVRRLMERHPQVYVRRANYQTFTQANKGASAHLERLGPLQRPWDPHLDALIASARKRNRQSVSRHANSAILEIENAAGAVSGTPSEEWYAKNLESLARDLNYIQRRPKNLLDAIAFVRRRQ
jgi:hypothetical protein